MLFIGQNMVRYDAQNKNAEYRVIQQKVIGFGAEGSEKCAQDEDVFCRSIPPFFKYGGKLPGCDG